MNTELPSDELNKINPVQTQFKWNCVHALSASEHIHYHNLEVNRTLKTEEKYHIS